MTNLQPNTLLDDLHPARFLQVSDLLERWKVQSITMTISRVTQEETIPVPSDLDPATADKYNPRGKPRVVMQPVIYFTTRTGAEWQAGYLLAAKIDVQSLKAATSATTIGELIGKRITIEVGEHRHKAVLRISANKPEEK